MDKTVGKKSSWQKVVLRLVLLLVLAVLVILLVLLFNPDISKRYIEKRVSILTHRALQINGEFDFELGRDLRLTATDISWANASWATQPTMMEIGKAVIIVDVASLIRPPVVLRNVKIENIKLDFEWDKEQQSNWSFGDDVTLSEEPLHSLPLLLDKADIRTLDLSFRHPELTDDLIINVVHAQHQSNDKDDLVVNIELAVDDKPVMVTGNIGPFPKLIVAGAVDFDLLVTGRESSLTLKGSSPELYEMQFSQLQSVFKAAETSDILKKLKLPVESHGPADLTIDYRSGNSGMDGKIKGNIGEFNFNAVIHADNLKNWQGIVLNAQSSGPSAKLVGRLAGVKQLPAEPYQLDLKIHDSGHGLLIDAVHFETAGAVINSTGSISGFPKLTGIKLDVDAHAASIKPFAPSLTDHDLPDLPVLLKGTIEQLAKGSGERLDVTFKFGDIDASMRGSLSEQEGFKGSTFQYKLNIPDSLILKDLFELPVRVSVPMAFSGGLNIEDAGPVLTGTSGQIGDNQLSFSSDIALGNIKNEFSSAFKLSGPDAARAAALFSENSKLPDSAFQLAGNLGYTQKKVTLSPVQGNLGDNQFKVNGSLQLQEEYPLINFEFSAEGPDLKQLATSFGIEKAPVGRFSTSGSLRVNGQSIDVSSLVFDIQGNQVKGSVGSGWPKQPDSFNFDITASGKNLQDLLPAIPNYTAPEAAFNIQAKGSADQRNIAIEAAEIRVGSARFEFSGQLGKAPVWSANQVRLTGSGDHLTELGTVRGWPFADKKFKISATMSGKQNELSVNDLELTVGSNDLQGKLQLNMQDKPKLNADISSTYMDLKELLANIEKLKESRATLAESAGGRTPAPDPKADRRLIPDKNIPFEVLNVLDGSLTLNFHRLKSRKLDLSKVLVQATLHDGLLSVPSFSAQSTSAGEQGGSGGINGKLQIQADAENSQVEISLTAKQLRFIHEELVKYVHGNSSGHDIDLHLSGQGNNLRSLAASLDGFIWVQGGKRTMDAEIVNYLYGDLLTQVLTTILPFGKTNQDQTLLCDRIFFEAKKGVLETAPSIMFRTDKVNIESIGLVNLSSEAINFNIQSTPREGLGVSTGNIVNSFFRFQGTIMEPKLRLDPTGTLVEGGAAFATAGLSIIAKSLYKRWLKKELSCEELTEEARKLRAKVDPTEVPAT